MNLSTVELRDLDLSGKHIERCMLSAAAFQNVTFAGCRFRLVYMDFSRLEGCSFKGSSLHAVVLAGSRITELVGCNLSGINCRDTVFDESDLYASRFISAVLTKVGFKDCNLKQVRFEHAAISDTDFRYSNTEDAYFEKTAHQP